MPHKVFKLTIDLGDDVVWVCKARCHSREEKHTPTQKHDTEDANIHQQQTQKKLEVQDPLLSQGQRKQFNHPEEQPQGTREQLSQQNQVEQQNQRNLWDRCLRERQQTHQCQREIQHERLQKQYQHSQQQVQFEPFHQQFTDEMQKVQDKVKQEKWFQKWRQEFKDQVQTQQPDEEECPIPPDYRQAPKQPTQQPLNGQYQPQQPQNLTQNPQAPSQYWKQPPNVPHYPQPRYQAQYQNLDQQIRQLRWQQWLQSQKQKCEVQDQKRFQTWQQQASQQLTKWQQAQYNARREHHQLQPREGRKQSRAHNESGIPDFPPSPFGTNEDSNDSDEEGYLESEEGEYESQGERDGSDNDPESHSETESESKVEEDKDEDDKEDNLGSESGFVFIRKPGRRPRCQCRWRISEQLP